ncbi:Flp pilus assembly protein CpaB|uniref:Flp pilus assembly protein CpaB n=1 Tax=Noviherbaspirillum sp. L7-7A TaxID=2850560 RepID=UPI001C2C7C2C|nr:Flp pilus assembly protein CpaB [Noviherbaspirillum sp. L7-7A]MBV0881083.1 Flp pilus assembly protein CpaB [Noviherbaspirillum sp. L7-7A]
MKNIKALALLLLAAAIGLAAAFYAAAWTSQRANIASNKVVVAAVDVGPGSKLTAQMLSTVDWPSGSLPSGAIQDLKALEDRVVKVGVVRGEALLEGKLAPVGTQGGLSAVIAEGKRAMTVRVNDVVGVAGFALPGNYVDVMVNAQRSKDGNGGDDQKISKTVLEHVLVLAVAQEASRDDTKPKVVSAVTLELSLEDSEKLDLARSIGTLSLVLRNQVDTKTVSTAGITKQQLFNDEAPAPVKIPASIKPVVSPKPPRPKSTSALTNCVEIIQNNAAVYNCF